jgi:hypothetical protein
MIGASRAGALRTHSYVVNGHHPKRRRDHFSHRDDISFRTALKALTEGAVLLNVVNLPQDAATAGMSDAAFVDKFVMIHWQQAQPDGTQARDRLYSGTVCMVQGSTLQGMLHSSDR